MKVTYYVIKSFYFKVEHARHFDTQERKTWGVEGFNNSEHMLINAINNHLRWFLLIEDL